MNKTWLTLYLLITLNSSNLVIKTLIYLQARSSASRVINTGSPLSINSVYRRFRITNTMSVSKFAPVYSTLIMPPLFMSTSVPLFISVLFFSFFDYNCEALPWNLSKTVGTLLTRGDKSKAPRHSLSRAITSRRLTRTAWNGVLVLPFVFLTQRIHKPISLT